MFNLLSNMTASPDYTQLRTDSSPAANKGFAIAGVSFSADSLVVAESFVLRMKFSAKTPRHRKPPNRWLPFIFRQ